MMKTMSEVCPVRPTYNTDGVLESQSYDENLLNITHKEMKRYVANGGQQYFDDAVTCHVKGGYNGGQHLYLTKSWHLAPKGSGNVGARYATR